MTDRTANKLTSPMAWIQHEFDQSGILVSVTFPRHRICILWKILGRENFKYELNLKLPTVIQRHVPQLFSQSRMFSTCLIERNNWHESTAKETQEMHFA